MYIYNHTHINMYNLYNVCIYKLYMYICVCASIYVWIVFPCIIIYIYIYQISIYECPVMFHVCWVCNGCCLSSYCRSHQSPGVQWNHCRGRRPMKRMDWNWRILGYLGYFLGYFPTILGDILFFGKYDSRILEKCPKKHDIELEKVGKSSFQFFVGELVYTWYTFTCCRHDPFMHIVQDNHAQCVAEM